MSIATRPANPHDNTSPVFFQATEQNFKDPFEIAALVAARTGLPQEFLDQVQSDCRSIAKDSWMGFLDYYQMTIPFKTDFIQFLETETMDFVIDDDGAVSRAGNVFTIDPSAIEGYTAGEDYFYFRPNFVVMVVDNTGKKEMGVITAIDKANDEFTAVCREGASWTVATTNLSIDGNAGGDFDKGSCGPEGLLELRKKTSSVLKMAIIKDAMKSTGGVRYGYCLDAVDGEYAWYDENVIKLRKRLNRMQMKQLLIDTESVDGSGAHAAGKFGTKALFQKLEQDGVTFTGYIETEEDLQELTEYYDELGFNGDKEFTIHCDTAQYRFLEGIAKLSAVRLGVTMNMDVSNGQDNWFNLGFSHITMDGYVFHFAKWGLTEGNSPLGKKRIKDAMPKAVIVPMGTVPTQIGGEERNVPYLFKAYQNMDRSPGMVRKFLTGAYAPTPTSDCEYEKITLSTTVGLGVVCPEALVICK